MNYTYVVPYETWQPFVEADERGSTSVAALSGLDVRKEAARISRAIPEMSRKADSLRDLQERSAQVKADLIDVAGQIIRVSDRLIDAIHALPPEQAAEQAEILGELEQGRKLAFERMAHLNPDQLWFWTEEWQAGERAVDRDIAAGVPGEGPMTGEEFLAALDAMRAESA